MVDRVLVDGSRLFSSFIELAVVVDEVLDRILVDGPFLSHLALIDG
jgi:hypothetical protein